MVDGLREVGGSGPGRCRRGQGDGASRKKHAVVSFSMIFKAGDVQSTETKCLRIVYADLFSKVL